MLKWRFFENKAFWHTFAVLRISVFNISAGSSPYFLGAKGAKGAKGATCVFYWMWWLTKIYVYDWNMKKKKEERNH